MENRIEILWAKMYNMVNNTREAKEQERLLKPFVEGPPPWVCKYELVRPNRLNRHGLSIGTTTHGHSQTKVKHGYSQHTGN